MLNISFPFPDINECLDNNGQCGQNCTNLNGTYSCFCRVGYYLFTGAEGPVPEAIINRTCLGMDYAKQLFCFIVPSLSVISLVHQLPQKSLKVIHACE